METEVLLLTPPKARRVAATEISHLESDEEEEESARHHPIPDPRTILAELYALEIADAAFTKAPQERAYSRVIIDLSAELVRRLNRAPPFPDDSVVAALVIALARETFIPMAAFMTPYGPDSAHPDRAQTLVLLLDPGKQWRRVRRVVTDTVHYMATTVDSLATLGIQESPIPGWPPYCIVIDVGEYSGTNEPVKLAYFFQRTVPDAPRATIRERANTNRGRTFAERALPYLVPPEAVPHFCAFIDGRGFDSAELDRLVCALLVNTAARVPELDSLQTTACVTLRIADALFVDLEALIPCAMHLCATTNPVPRLTTSRDLRVSDSPRPATPPTDKQIEERGRRLVLTFALIVMLAHRVAASTSWCTPRTTPRHAFRHLLRTQPASLIFTSMYTTRTNPSDFHGSLETVIYWLRRAYIDYTVPSRGSAITEARIVEASKTSSAYAGIWGDWAYVRHISFEEHEVQVSAALTDLRRIFMGWLDPAHYNSHYHNAKIEAELVAVRTRREEVLTKIYIKEAPIDDPYIHLLDIDGTSNGTHH